VVDGSDKRASTTSGGGRRPGGGSARPKLRRARVSEPSWRDWLVVRSTKPTEAYERSVAAPGRRAVWRRGARVAPGTPACVCDIVDLVECGGLWGGRVRVHEARTG